MSHDGPPLEHLLRRLASTPAAFLAEPRVRSGGDVVVEAVVFDALTDLGHRMSEAEVASFANRDPRVRNWLRLVLIASWLIHDESFRPAQVGPGVLEWLTTDTRELSEVVDAGQFVSDPDRREELSRRLLAALGWVPAGESARQAADRLSTVDSVERARVLAETAAKRARAKQLREQMEKERVREAAARYSRE